VIEPGKNTAKGGSSELLDAFGLVGHPGIFYVHIEHEGNEDGGKSTGPTLKYVARNMEESSRPHEFLFSAGSSFYSVGTDELKFGYYHSLENISTAQVRLRLRIAKI
jgi:hypothetical protein